MGRSSLTGEESIFHMRMGESSLRCQRVKTEVTEGHPYVTESYQKSDVCAFVTVAKEKLCLLVLESE